MTLTRTPAGSVVASDTDHIGQELERLAVERYALTLREQVRRMLVIGDEARQLKGRILTLLEVTTHSAGASASAPAEPAAAAQFGRASVDVGSS